MRVKEVEEKDKLLKIPKNLWAVKTIEECNFWFLKTGVQYKYMFQMLFAEWCLLFIVGFIPVSYMVISECKSEKNMYL